MRAPDLQAARQQLAEMVRRGELVADSPGQFDLTQAELGIVTKQFFAEYSAVRSIRGGLVVARSEIAPSEYLAGFISIGHSEDWDVVQRPGSDEVFVVEGGETENALEIRFASVYHFLLAEASA